MRIHLNSSELAKQSKQSNKRDQQLANNYNSNINLSKQSSFSSQINNIINDELCSNNMLRDKSLIYENHKKRIQQVTYLKPESVNKLHQSFIKMPFSEISVNKKSKRSKSLVNNLMMERVVGETIQDDINDEIIINSQASKRDPAMSQNNQLQQLIGKRDPQNKEDLFKNESKTFQKQYPQQIQQQRFSVISKNKRSQSVNSIIKNNSTINYITQSQFDTLISKESNEALQNNFIEQKLLLNQAKSGNIREIQKVYKQINDFNLEKKQKSQYDIREFDNSHNNSILNDEPVSKSQKMEEIRENYYSNLKELLKIADKDILVLKSKQLFDSSFAIMKKTVEDYDQIIKELKGRIFRLNNENAELETTNEWLKRLNKQLDKQKQEISDNLQAIMRQLKDMNSFKDSYILMQTKFSNINLERFIANYEILDKKSFEYLTKLNIIEDEKYQLGRQCKEAKEIILILEKEIEQLKLSKDGLKQFPSSRSKFEQDNDIKFTQTNSNQDTNIIQKSILDQIKQKDKQNEDHNYKKVLSMYNRLLDRQSILSFNEEIVKCNLDDPLDILTSIEKVIQFNAFQSYQQEMKNIIIASNKLIKACYDESSAEIFNEHVKFDCEAIYSKVLSYITSLKLNIKQLKNQVASYQLLIKS